MAGGVLSPHRDLALITTLVQLVRSCARSLATLVCVDGLASYVTAFRRVFRYPVRTDALGWPRLVLEKGLLLGQTVPFHQLQPAESRALVHRRRP